MSLENGKDSKMYLITEPYDGSHVRIIASARTPEAAEKQFDRESSIRAKKGYGFFGPVRRIIAPRKAIENELDRRLSALPTWD